MRRQGADYFIAGYNAPAAKLLSSTPYKIVTYNDVSKEKSRWAYVKEAMTLMSIKRTALSHSYTIQFTLITHSHEERAHNERIRIF